MSSPMFHELSIKKVSPEAAGYFTRRKLIAGQVIEKTLEDGGLIVSTKVAHPNQILPIVRYWIPHVRVISPEHLQTELEEGVRGYLGGWVGLCAKKPRLI